jgi:hypothetical protein
MYFIPENQTVERGLEKEGGIQVRWEKGVCGEMNGNYLGTGLVIYVGIISVFKRVEVVIGCIEGVILRGHLCEIISVNVGNPVESKCDDTKEFL